MDLDRRSLLMGFACLPFANSLPNLIHRQASTVGAYPIGFGFNILRSDLAFIQKFQENMQWQIAKYPLLGESPSERIVVTLWDRDDGDDCLAPGWMPTPWGQKCGDEPREALIVTQDITKKGRYRLIARALELHRQEVRRDGVEPDLDRLGDVMIEFRRA